MREALRWQPAKNETDRREEIDGKDLSQNDTIRNTQCDWRYMCDCNRIYHDYIRGNVIKKQEGYFILVIS